MSEMNLSPLGLYSARPTLRIDGQDSDLASGLMQSLVMREQEGGMSSLELAFVNFAPRDDGTVGPAFEDERLIKLGAQFKVYVGEAAAPTEIFSGTVSALEYLADTEGPPRLQVLAEDGAQKARLSRRVAVFENQSLADITRDLAGRMGLSPVVTGFTDALDLEVQLNETDLGFLRRLLARHGGDVQLVGNELQVSPRKDVQRNQITLRMNSQLQRVRAVADLADQVTEVRVTGFDALQGQSVEGMGSSAPLGPGQGRKGADLVREVFGERVQHSAHRLALTQREAEALAQAEFEQRSRRFVRIEGVCEGNPSLRVGSQVTLQDVSPRFDNSYYVVACTHRYDMKKGFETEFQAEGAFFNLPA